MEKLNLTIPTESFDLGEAVAPTIGITEEASEAPIAATQAVVGVRTKTELGHNVVVKVNVVRGNNGKVRTIRTKGGFGKKSAVMVFSNVIIADAGEFTSANKLMASHYVPFMNTNPRSHLRIDREGMLAPNFRGTLCPTSDTDTKHSIEMHPVISGKPGWKNFEVLFDGKPAYFRKGHYTKLSQEVRYSLLNGWFEEASEGIVAGEKRGVKPLYATKKLRNSDTGSIYTGRVLEFKDDSSGYAAFRTLFYKQDDGTYTATTYVRDNLTVNCPDCGTKAYDSDFTDDFDFTCHACGHHEEKGGIAPIKVLAHLLIPVVERMAYLESGFVPSHRLCSASCAECDHCNIVSYTQNSDDPYAECALDLRDTMRWSQHPEEDYKDLVFMGSGAAYLGHSVAPDDTVGLDGDFHVATFDRAAGDAELGPQLIPTRSGWVEKAPHVVVLEDFDNSGNVIFAEYVDLNARARFTPKQKAMMFSHTGMSAGYEIPKWLTEERLVEMYHQFGRSLSDELGTDDPGIFGDYMSPKELKNLIEPPIGVADGDQLLTEIEFDLKYDNRNEILRRRRMVARDLRSVLLGHCATYQARQFVPDSLITESTEHRTVLEYAPKAQEYALARFVTYDTDHNEVFVQAIEPDTVPDVDGMMQILTNLHPLFKAIVLEEGLEFRVHDLFPKVLRDMQEYILAEAGPRMIKVGALADLMKEAFDQEPCMAFRFKDTGARARGLASYVARQEMICMPDMQAALFAVVNEA